MGVAGSRVEGAGRIGPPTVEFRTPHRPLCGAAHRRTNQWETGTAHEGAVEWKRLPDHARHRACAAYRTAPSSKTYPSASGASLTPNP